MWQGPICHVTWLGLRLASRWKNLGHVTQRTGWHSEIPFGHTEHGTYRDYDITGMRHNGPCDAARSLLDIKSMVRIGIITSLAWNTTDRVTQRDPFWTYRAWYISKLWHNGHVTQRTVWHSGIPFMTYRAWYISELWHNGHVTQRTVAGWAGWGTSSVLLSQCLCTTPQCLPRLRVHSKHQDLCPR